MGIAFDVSTTAQQLADIIPHGIAIINYQDELVSANRTFRNFIPCSNTSFSDCWLHSVHSDDLDRVLTGYRDALENNDPLRMEYHTRDKHAMWCVMTLNPLDETSQKLFGLSEHGFICTLVDITPEKKAEISQRRLTKEAEDRKEQQERFIDMISHEIRNPLSAILHCTEDIVDELQVKKKEDIRLSNIAEAAQTISLCVAHQKKIVSDVLTFSKLDASMLSLSPRRVKPKEHFAAPLSLFRPELRRNNIKFEYKADYCYSDCQIDWVMADLDRMGQVLINLLSNAIKFTSKSKKNRRIRVAIGASTERPSSYPPNVVFFDPSEEALRVDATDTAEWGDGQIAYIMVAVKDTGIGISDHAQKRLFERFNQATPKTETTYGGSGLGLSVSRKICHLHGGEIGVSSQEGQGSTFGFFFKVRRSFEACKDDNKYDTLELDKVCRDIQTLGQDLAEDFQSTEEVSFPKDPSMTNVEEIKPGAPRDERTSHTTKIADQVDNDNYEGESGPHAREKSNPYRRLLVVEDNVINRRVLSKKLRTLGFKVIEASNGQEALDSTQDSRFDCILMDQEMPVMDGNTATIKIRELEKIRDIYTPVLGVTANVRQPQQTEMLEAGMDDIIHKPYSTDEIVAKIHHLVTKTRKKMAIPE